MSQGKKRSEEGGFEEHTYFIFASWLMLHLLSQSGQWFLDGTFNFAPAGFRQLLIIMVYLEKLKIFYPAAYILATGKSQALYTHVLTSLKILAEEQDLTLKPDLIMTDFEVGLRKY